LLDQGQSDVEIRHATTLAARGRGIMIEGASGTGKSTLAIRMMSLGARLVADDRTCLRRGTGTVPLWADAPETLPPLLEVRRLGLVATRLFGPAPLIAVVDLEAPAETDRHPEPRHCKRLGCRVRLFHPGPDIDLAGPLLFAVASLSVTAP